MKAVGLDTCVVLRLLLAEPEAQAKQALDYVEQCYCRKTSVLVSDLVVAEVYHALCYHYRVPVREAAQTLLDFLSSPMVTPTGHALTVLQDYKGTGAGLVDRLIRADLLDRAETVLTFDKKFARLPQVRQL